MNTNDAVAKRISQLLIERRMTQYKLEQKSCVYKLARGFDMTVNEFLNDELFDNDNIDVDE